MMKKVYILFLAITLFSGCLGQANSTLTPLPSDTPSPTPNPNNPPKITKFNHSWTGGDKDRPWTCSNNNFTAEVSDPDGDKFSVQWYDNGNRIYLCENETSCETKFWPDGLHTIKLTATDEKGAQSVFEKQIDVKYEVPEPIPVQTKNDLNMLHFMLRQESNQKHILMIHGR